MALGAVGSGEGSAVTDGAGVVTVGSGVSAGSSVASRDRAPVGSRGGTTIGRLLAGVGSRGLSPGTNGAGTTGASLCGSPGAGAPGPPLVPGCTCASAWPSGATAPCSPESPVVPEAPGAGTSEAAPTEPGSAVD